MTISISPNADGTVTVTCGTESIKIGSAPAGGVSAGGTSSSGPILWPNGGASASLVSNRGLTRIRVLRGRSGADIAEAVQKQMDRPRGPEATILQLHVEGSESFGVAEIEKAFAAAGEVGPMGIQIIRIDQTDG